jgi:hypothetical protein
MGRLAAFGVVKTVAGDAKKRLKSGKNRPISFTNRLPGEK